MSRRIPGHDAVLVPSAPVGASPDPSLTDPARGSAASLAERLSALGGAGPSLAPGRAESETAASRAGSDSSSASHVSSALGRTECAVPGIALGSVPAASGHSGLGDGPVGADVDAAEPGGADLSVAGWPVEADAEVVEEAVACVADASIQLGPGEVGHTGAAPDQAQPIGPAAADPASTGQVTIEEVWAAYLAERTRALRDRLVVHYTPLLRAVAHRVGSALPSYVEVADLVQCGVFGLIDAVERFDPERCPRFESYAAQRIRGAILDELRAQDWVPRTVRGRLRELERAQERLEARLLRAATDNELADELGLAVHEVRTLARQVQMISMEALDENSGGVSEILACDPSEDPMVRMQAHETLRHLAAAVAQLEERDRAVVRLYYLENRTLAEIGKVLGVTESRVCQLHTRLVGRLRGRMEELAAG
jgi:RNA polymerase sigma factor for flagellar operon FliA